METREQSELRNKPKENVFLKNFQSLLLALMTAALIGSYQKIATMNESIIRMEEREKMKTDKIDIMQLGIDRIQLDMMNVKDRLTRVEDNQNNFNNKN